jgi:dTDP-4-amino-4,6-dideoxygalactose transaminase
MAVCAQLSLEASVPQVPFVDLKSQGHVLLPEYEAALVSIVDRAAYVMGSEMRDFESAFADFCACRHAISVSSGTDALTLAYLAVGVGPGTSHPAGQYVHYDRRGGEPRRWDAWFWSTALRKRRTSTRADRARSLPKRTKAVVPVHLFGQPADVDAVTAAAETRPRRHRRCVPGPRCHGQGRVVGSLGAIAAFSFYRARTSGRWVMAGGHHLG